MTFQRRYLYLARDVRKMAVDLYSMQRPDHLPITRGSCHCLEQWYLMKWGCHEIHGAGCGGVDFTKYPTSHWKNNNTNTTQSLSLS